MSVHAGEKSDEVVVPLKRPNNGSSLPAEAVEGRTSPKGNSRQAATVRAQSRVAVSPGLAAVRRPARQSTSVQFTSLLHHLTVELLERSYFALKRNSAPGIDGVTWRAYGENLDEKLTELHARIHRGGYRARPARRTYIPKPDGTERPLSILCLKDKIVQQAVVLILEAIWEADFLGFSYGFRPGRGPHDALDALHAGIYRKRVGWVHRNDAMRFMADLRERLKAFALSLHPGKTRLVEFGRFAARDRQRRGLGNPESFTFLGFTHLCGQSRAGKFLLKRKSRRDRQASKLRDIKNGLKRRTHRPIEE